MRPGIDLRWGGAAIALLCAGLSGSPQDVAGVSVAARQATVRTLSPLIEAGSGGMAVDAQGRAYMADFGERLTSGPGGTKVVRVTADGTVSVFATGFRGASGNAFDSKGRLFQSNIGGNTISVVDPDGTVTEFANEGLVNPVGIVIDPGDTLFVANCGSASIQKIAPDGTSSLFVRTPLLRCPNGIARDDSGNLYVANFGNGAVIRVTPAGEVSTFATIPGGNNGHLTFANGVLYVVARGAHQLYELTLDGELTLLAGTGERGLHDGPALEATLSFPNDIAPSPDGKVLYFNDVAAEETDGILLSPTVVRMLILDGGGR